MGPYPPQEEHLDEGSIELFFVLVALAAIATCVPSVADLAGVHLPDWWASATLAVFVACVALLAIDR